jgi:polysaccharide pyruvyl transferase WcaK-like protein
MRTDLTLIFDAILFDRSLYNPLFNYLSTLSLLLPLAKRRGKLMGFYNVGAGPVDSAHGQKILRDISELMDFITVRDQESLELLKKLNVRNPRMLLTADAALNLRPAEQERARQILLSKQIDIGRQFLAVNINQYLDTWARPKRPSMGKDRFLEVYASALRRFRDQTGEQIAIFVTQHHDVSISQELADRIGGAPVPLIANADYSHYEITRCMEYAGLLFGMRLHSVILASSVITPVIGLAYQPKVEHYLKLLGLGEFSLSFDNFSTDSVFSHILRGWESRDKIRGQLQKVIPDLKRRANVAAELVAGLDRGSNLDALLSSDTSQTISQLKAG